ncbi:UNVERIFIED_CONTAM: Retrovirus-related Pol polyprotein from transposon.6 [Sesamum latifolium]|uniref:Retrovirus-related Pol polyprotein from transposon.6 n=1 Tax=Sesamum latifolium TaxID=2727402 RepID=A0AAW2TJW7_9LAMI
MVEFPWHLPVGFLYSFYAIRPVSSHSPDTCPTEPLFPDFVPPDLRAILTKYNLVFSVPHGLPPHRPQDDHIHLLPNYSPVNIKPHRYPHFQKDLMTKIIQDMLLEGIIKPSTSSFSSPVLLVRKKYGTWRFCVDYMALNAVTVRDRFPIPTVDELLDKLHGASIFTKLDLQAGYHQIRVVPDDTHKIAFQTIDGHFEFLVMPFGLTNAPSTFQSVMNNLFRPYFRWFVLIFFYDILIYSASWSSHLSHLDQAIEAWPTPQSVMEPRAFLGLMGYYCRFVRHYAAVASPLTNPLKGHRFDWTPEAAVAFGALKAAMMPLLILSLPNFELPFDVTIDASQVAVGAVLSQNRRFIAFFSKKLGPRLQAASTYDPEMYANSEAVRKWRQYLLGRKFHIFTDQQSLRGLMTQTVLHRLNNDGLPSF